jgi:hypothetical protein
MAAKTDIENTKDSNAVIELPLPNAELSHEEGGKKL